MKVYAIVASLCLLQLCSTYAEDPQGTYCNGQRQSPVDIVRNSISYKNISSITFNNLDEIPLIQTILSDTFTIKINSTFNRTPTISGGPLDTYYTFHNIHFHWGDNDRKGSEHTRQGHSSPMEMHVVFTREELTLDEAKQNPEGIAVIGYFVEIKNTFNLFGLNKVTAIGILTDTMKGLTEPLISVNMLKKFAIGKLAVPFPKYYTYLGSLTSDNCEEVVTWIIPKINLKITRNQIQVFRSLYGKGLVDSPNNYRSTQPLNGRKICVNTRGHRLLDN